MPSGLTPWAEPASFGPFMELDENEMSTVRAECEKDYPQHDVTEVMYRGYWRRTLLDHYRLEYQWNGCSGQLLLNARRVP